MSSSSEGAQGASRFISTKSEENLLSGSEHQFGPSSLSENLLLVFQRMQGLVTEV